MNKLLDLTKPLQFRDPNYGQIIDVIPNPNGEEDSKLIVNLLRGKVIYTACRYNTGRSEVGEELNGDIVHVPEKKRYEYWVYYFEGGTIFTCKEPDAWVLGDTIYAEKCIHIEHVVRELNA